MTFAGLDLHKKEVEALVLSEDGRILQRSRFPATRAALETFAQTHLSRDATVAVEATTNTWPVAAILQPLVHRVVVSNPLRTKAIASAKIKTDKVDALAPTPASGPPNSGSATGPGAGATRATRTHGS